jgi:transcriptional regulator with XRE-family HTH domain
MNVPDTVKETRKRLGMSQQAFASHIGYSLRAVANWEGGEKQPDSRSRRALIEAARSVGLDSDLSAGCCGETDILRRKAAAFDHLEHLIAAGEGGSTVRLSFDDATRDYVIDHSGGQGYGKTLLEAAEMSLTKEEENG